MEELKYTKFIGAIKGKPLLSIEANLPILSVERDSTIFWFD